MNFFVRWLITAVAAAVAIWLVPGIFIGSTMETWLAIAIFALFLSLVNVVIKPILQVLSIPITILTLGIFYLVVNTFLIYIAAWLANVTFNIGFEIAGFGSAFLAAIIISIVSAILNMAFGTHNQPASRTTY